MSVLTRMARELLAIDEDISYRLEGCYTTVDDFELYTFEQCWSDTTCGFGGVGGQTIMTARTYVFVPLSVNEKCYVYIDGDFAYCCEWNKTFQNDLENRRMAGQVDSYKYMHKNNN